MYDLNCPFDMEMHKKTYTNYLEVVILPSGKIEYAVPSHQEKLISIGMKKFNLSRNEFLHKCPQSMYFDFIGWLTDITKCISVWNNEYIGKPNRFQKRKIDLLIRNGLLKP